MLTGLYQEVELTIEPPLWGDPQVTGVQTSDWSGHLLLHNQLSSSILDCTYPYAT